MANDEHDYSPNLSEVLLHEEFSKRDNGAKRVT